MAKIKLSTEPYKGVRDFYPADQFTQKYLFETMARSCELFGYEEYSASVLEPTDLYRSKTSEEIVNEQTYTFLDRGEREVTLRIGSVGPAIRERDKHTLNHGLALVPCAVAIEVVEFVAINLARIAGVGDGARAALGGDIQRHAILAQAARTACTR